MQAKLEGIYSNYLNIISSSLPSLLTVHKFADSTAHYLINEHANPDSSGLRVDLCMTEFCMPSLLFFVLCSFAHAGQFMTKFTI